VNIDSTATALGNLPVMYSPVGRCGAFRGDSGGSDIGPD